MRVLTVFAGMVLVSLLLIAYVPQPADAATVTITVNLDEYLVGIDVDPSKESSATFHGSVNVNMTGMGATQTEVHITMGVWTDSSWEVWVTPVNMVFYFNTPPINFTVTVRSDRTWMAHGDIEQVHIGGTAEEVAMGQTRAEYSLDAAIGKLSANQFYKLDAWCDDPSKIVQPGKAIIFPIHIHNQGNGRDTVSIEGVDYAQSPGMEEEGFSVVFPSRKMVISPQTSERIEVQVIAPDGAEGGKEYSFGIIYRSLLARDQGIIEPDTPLTLYLEIEADNPENIRMPSEFFAIGLIVSGAFILIGLVVGIIMVKRALKEKK